MPLASIPAEQMREVVKELDQAAYNHEQWAEMFHGTLISRMPPDDRDIDEDAHRKCRFGQWYHNAANSMVHDYPGFAEIGLAHERMHKTAARLLRSSAEQLPISTQDYESFVTARKRLGLEIASVRDEFRNALNSLDPLTGTPGRVGMLTELRAQLGLVKRKLITCVIAMMDLDHFKIVNDTYGHVVGDEVLIKFARHVATHLRSYDRVFRYGGEEFLICLPGTDLQHGSEIANRLREDLAALSHKADGRESFSVTASFGLCLLDPEVSVEQSIDRADRALYAAKQAGRNRVLAWESSMKSAPA